MPKKKSIYKSKTAIGIYIAIVVLVVIYFAFFRKTQSYQFITAQRGSISEIVSLTGSTAPTQSVSLAFNSSGIISNAYSSLGKKIQKGQVLAELNINDLFAQYKQAQANVDVQQARLEGLQTGARPEDIASTQAALDKAKQDLANMYSSINDSSIDSYSKANDAVRNQLENFFTNAEAENPKLTYITIDSKNQNDAETQRRTATLDLNAWQNKLIAVGQSNSDLENLLQSENGYLADIRQMLNSVSKTLDYNTGSNSTSVTASKTLVSNALNEVNVASKNLNTLSQSISSQKIIVAQAQAQLDLKKAGSLVTDISAQQAQVEQAKASVQSAEAKLQNARIIAPISGTITQFDAKVGQLASPSVPLVSIMSDAGYEVDAGASETDVGKIMLDNKVTMTFDAFSGKVYAGKVFYIAPSETNNQGVVSYQIKISLDDVEPRLKSGLTTNIDIETDHKDDVLVLPQYAILQNDAGTFVETLVNNKVVKNPVKLGIQDQKGNVEVVSGVTENESVLNIGLRAQ